MAVVCVWCVCVQVWCVYVCGGGAGGSRGRQAGQGRQAVAGGAGVCVGR